MICELWSIISTKSFVPSNTFHMNYESSEALVGYYLADGHNYLSQVIVGTHREILIHAFRHFSLWILFELFSFLRVLFLWIIVILSTAYPLPGMLLGFWSERALGNVWKMVGGFDSIINCGDEMRSKRFITELTLMTSMNCFGMKFRREIRIDIDCSMPLQICNLFWLCELIDPFGEWINNRFAHCPLKIPQKTTQSTPKQM